MLLPESHVCLACRDDGVGLAAPQIGMNIRMMVFNPHGKDKPGSASILVNPGRHYMCEWLWSTLHTSYLTGLQRSYP